MSNNTDIIFLLDESGSMSAMGNEAVDSINSFIKEQQDLSDNSKFTLYTFNNNVSTIIDDVIMSDIKPLSYDKYNPFGATSLFDAIGHAITTKKKTSDNKNVIMVILTDGHENSSKEYTKENIHKLVSEMENDFDWNFIYLAANQNAILAGNSLGIKAAQCSSFEHTKEGLSTVCKFASNSISNYKTNSSKIDVNLNLTT